ncbi:MAG: peptidoglycan DD-metalloendopeptidase family protein [Bacteroidia bacterium]|nr:peptidoglycan DD-metalloendopeptidase family protein [Bacteroidia bacterium]
MKGFIHICIFLAMMVVTPSFAGNLHKDDERNKPGDDKKSKAKRDDTTHHALNTQIAEVEEDEQDTSSILFPSNDLYATWDTTTIHPYNFGDCFRADSVTICLTDLGEGRFAMPFKGMITSEFGWRRYRPHYGTDIDLEIGDTVVSAFDGMVRIARSKISGYGNVVIIRHANGLETVYAHLSKILVEAGQPIKAGEILGLGGNTGRSYGAHLHFEMRYLGQALDTEDFIDYAKGDLKTYEFTLRKSDVENKYDLRAMHNRHRHDVGAVKYTTKNGVKYGIYRVRPGDNLGVIAKRCHTTVSAICKKNGIKPTKILQIGQKLKV